MTGGHYTTTSGIVTNAVILAAVHKDAFDALDEEIYARIGGGSTAIPTIDINGGTIDGATIGGSSAAAGTFLALVGTGLTINGDGALVNTGALDTHLYIKANAGQYREVNFQTGGEPRWAVGTDNAAESGALAGTNFKITSFDDDGLNAADRLTINRATGAVVIANTLRVGQTTINGAAATYRALNFQSTSVQRAFIGLSNGAESGANVGSDFILVMYDDAGSYLNSPLTITRATGAIATGTNLGVGGGTFGTSAANVLMLKNGTAPGSSPADSVQLYAEDVTGSSELKVRDEAGNVTTLSPHNPQMVDTTGRITDYVHKEYNALTGQDIEIDLFRAVEWVGQQAGETLIHSRRLSPGRRENPYLRKLNQRRVALRSVMHG